MTAYAKNAKLCADLNRQGIPATLAQATTLRRAEMTLHRWSEGECGDSNDRASWCITRDDDGKTYREFYPNVGKMSRTRVPDRETATLKRVAALCESLGVHFYHQGDPRGCALYLSTEPLTDSNYPSRGVAIV